MSVFTSAVDEHNYFVSLLTQITDLKNLYIPHVTQFLNIRSHCRSYGQPQVVKFRGSGSSSDRQCHLPIGKWHWCRFLFKYFVLACQYLPPMLRIDAVLCILIAVKSYCLQCLSLKYSDVPLVRMTAKESVRVAFLLRECWFDTA